ncbi:uncharacterized protein PITG_17620 [Phytophthora infestans T30-4]|uniref:Uncharacterized protein n=1 Tax=Phytophthora infestans (strain T30-4) TaxID=403677 RepID=D0NWT6_PHYIT|nr:uncharacterized protein PITG_17620 [Phytophthora infestans T30-4]EEY67519.1 conserved hypothetical protein [Phytophthora infestans T30-4]|eukprot:XP_002896492.1 conserved hypothetical protein [Phytophthora infestans T30-4]
MHVISSAPAAPSRNPPRTSYSSLGGRTVRLEAPDGLTGRWDGPVYATIGREPSLRESAASLFFDDADGLKRPGWQATLTFLLPGQRRSDVDPALQEHVDVKYWIPHWRLTQPSHDLSEELLERPLLSVFRFLRFSQFFVASADCDTKFVRHTSEVYLCGQALTYGRASTIVLVDDINLVLDPGCNYLCMMGPSHLT